jgi:phosphate transport system permease protein
LPQAVAKRKSLVKTEGASRIERLASFAGEAFLFLIASCSAIAVLFIFMYIARDAIPFFKSRGFTEFFTSTKWYPSGHPAEFGVFAILVGSGLVTLGSMVFAVPLGIAAAVCLSDVLPFAARQVIKPIIEILAAIPSVAYGFFALVVLAPILQSSGGHVLGAAAWMIGAPIATLAMLILCDVVTDRIGSKARTTVKVVLFCALEALVIFGFIHLGGWLNSLVITSGTNALNVSMVLGIMALPTIVSVSEDALQAVGRDLREGSYALGSTRSETLLRIVIPAASSGICAAVMLGTMRAVGETMVVWMASGNAAQIPTPWYNMLEPVRTLTATIAGDMGEADQVTGSDRFHVLFAMALCLLAFSFAMNVGSEWIAQRSRKRTGR